MQTDIVQTILWRRVDSPGHDACALLALEDGWALKGAALFRMNGQPCSLHYTIMCDPSWQTRSASVDGWVGGTEVKIHIDALPDQRWCFNGAEQSETDGLVDLDLGFTPATNLIQFRRLSLDIGQQTIAPTAYLRFPELTLGRLEHYYHRLAVDRYDYRAPEFDYTAILQVSDAGFVTEYPGLWELEALQ